MRTRAGVAGLALAGAMALAPAATSALRPGTAAIEGRLTYAPDQGEPVRRALVTLRGAAIGDGRMRLTDADGRFAFGDLPAGRYTLEATKAPHLPAYYGSRRPGRGPGLPIALADGERVADVAMTMTRGAVIAGRILDAHGRPQRNAIVSVLARALSGETLVAIATATTDDRGEYRVYGLPAGRYLVAAQAGFGYNGAAVATEADFRWAAAEIARRRGSAGSSGAHASAPPPRRQTVSYAPTLYPGVASPSAATAVDVAAGAERTGIDIQVQLVPTTRLRGKVVGPDGAAPPDVRVGVVWPGHTLGLTEKNYIGNTPSNLGMTVRNGEFTRYALVPGRYAFVARAKDLWALVEIDITGELERDLLITLEPGMTVRGHAIVQAGAGGARPRLRLVPLSDSLNLPPAPASIGDDGAFAFEGVAPGDYGLALDDPAGRFTIGAARAGGTDVADGILTVRTGLDVSDLDVAIEPRRPSLTGRVLDVLGRPAPEFVVAAFSTDRSTWRLASRRITEARPATDGTYTVSGLPAGDYFIVGLTELEPGALEDPALLEALAAQAATVTIGREPVSMDLRVAGPGR